MLEKEIAQKPQSADIHILWRLLQSVQSVTFETHGSPKTGWSGTGVGTVRVTMLTTDVLTFHESGTWRPGGGRELSFSNVYRWTRTEFLIRLEHLRFGVDHPIFLFDLRCDSDGNWISMTPHHCREDTYSARLHRNGSDVHIAWTVAGPEKQESIAYRYFP